MAVEPSYCMRCPICFEQNENTRSTINARDMVGHLLGMHTKPEIARMFAKILWQQNISNNGEAA